MNSLNRVLAASAVLATCWVATSVTAEEPRVEEIKVFIVTDFGAPYCAGGDASPWEDYGDAWYDELDSKPFYEKDGKYLNGSMKDSMFTDEDEVAWGEDHDYLDHCDAALICTHGRIEGDGYWSARMRVDETGPGDCYSELEDMSLGDLDLEFLHLSSCHSLDEDLWDSEWPAAMDDLHQVDGFHGVMLIVWNWISDYEDFADEAYSSSSVATAWVDNMYHLEFPNDPDCSQCPVAFAEGDSRVNVSYRLNNETYYNKYSFSSPTGGFFAKKYVSGCEACGGVDPL